MTAGLKSAWQRFELWFWGKFFIFLIALGAGPRRRRMSHNNGIAGKGTLRIVDNPEFPATDFFEPGRVFPCRLRHGAGGYLDDSMKLVRSASLKFADSSYRSPLDIQMNTGIHCFFWSAKSFLDFAFSRNEHDGIEYIQYYEKHAWGRRSAAAALIPPPSSYTRLHYHSHTPFGWHARDGKTRYVRFRLIPSDRGPMENDPPQEYIDRADRDMSILMEVADQKYPAAQNLSVNYLKNEYRERIESGPIRYVLQVQLHEASDSDSEEVFNPMFPWDEATHPYHDLATVEINELLPYEESQWMAFEVTNHPPSMSLLPSRSIHDYNSLNYMRAQSIWAIRVRWLFLRLFGPRAELPDDAPHNLRPAGM